MSTVGHCKNCRHWKQPEYWNQITRPTDPDTYEDMATGFEVRQCQHPKLTFCERPVESDGFGVCDGSEYRAELYTAGDFGCVRWQA